MRTEVEVKDLLNDLYNAFFEGGINQLDVRESEYSYLIILKENGGAKYISRELVDQYFSVDHFVALRNIIKIFNELRQPSED